MLSQRPQFRVSRKARICAHAGFLILSLLALLGGWVVVRRSDVWFRSSKLQVSHGET